MEKILTKNITKNSSQDIDVYIKGGGYEALRKALSMKQEDIISEVMKSGLFGRGGAAFPLGLKWIYIQHESASPKYIVCNADEGEPGTFKDRVILRQDPHLLIESMIIAGYTIGAKEGFIYIRGEYYREIEAIQKAVEQARSKHYLGTNILNSGFSFRIAVCRGAGAYVCGEETSLLQSIAGVRASPRNRPPFPSHKGLFNKPTVVNNVETLINIPFIINNGSKKYAAIGSPDSPGPKLFCLSGHVRKRGLYEIPLGITLRELIDSYGGGMLGEFKAALTGGVSSSLIKDMDVKLDYKNVANAGSMLGSASVIVLNKETNIIDVAKNTMEFFAHESCGKCSICREGTRRGKEILNRLANKEGLPGDIALLQEMGRIMYDTACCGLGQAAMNVPVSAIKLFRKEFEDGVKTK